MDKFRTKPITVEAVRVTDEAFDASYPDEERVSGVRYDPRQHCAFIPLPAGTKRADIGDWIIRSANGELYSCKDDVFKAAYESDVARMATSRLPVRRWLRKVFFDEHNIEGCHVRAGKNE